MNKIGKVKSLNMLYPPFEKVVKDILSLSVLHSLNVGVYESWRSPQRQNELYAIGREVDKHLRPVTRALGWESWHQYGVAVDIVFRDVAGRWTWEGDWQTFGSIIKSHGLIWGGDFKDVDKPHVEWPTQGLTEEEAQEINEVHGVIGVWYEIEKRQNEQKSKLS